MASLRKTALDETAGKRARRNARNDFILLWWGRWFGVRTMDAAKMKWNNLITINGIPHISYAPHKTEKYGTHIKWPIGEDAYNEILPFVGKPDDFCIETKKHAERAPIHGKYANDHSTVVSRVSKFFRSIGCNGWASFYNLRYRTSQVSVKKVGPKGEEDLLGHSQLTGAGHYYDKNDHSLVI